MATNNFLIFLVIMLVLGGIVAGSRYLRNRKKAERFTALGQQHGWRYVPRDLQLPDQFSGEPFGVGDERTARHVLTGPYRGREVTAFDYTYVMDHGSSTESSNYTYKWSVIAVEAQDLSPQATSYLKAGQRIAAGNLLTWQEGLLDPAGVINMLDAACDALERIPPQFWGK